MVHLIAGAGALSAGTLRVVRRTALPSASYCHSTTSTVGDGGGAFGSAGLAAQANVTKPAIASGPYRYRPLWRSRNSSRTVRNAALCWIEWRRSGRTQEPSSSLRAMSSQVYSFFAKSCANSISRLSRCNLIVRSSRPVPGSQICESDAVSTVNTRRAKAKILPIAAIPITSPKIAKSIRTCCVSIDSSPSLVSEAPVATAAAVATTPPVIHLAMSRM